LQSVNNEHFGTLDFFKLTIRYTFSISNISKVRKAVAQYRQFKMHHLNRCNANFLTDCESAISYFMEMDLWNPWIFMIGKDIMKLAFQCLYNSFSCINGQRALLFIIKSAYI